MLLIFYDNAMAPLLNTLLQENLRNLLNNSLIPSLNEFVTI